MSAVGAAAYRAADKIENASGEIFDFSKKGGVVYSEIDLCRNAPEEYQDRGILWRSVEAIDNKSNSQLCREVEVAIPKEITDRESQKNLIREYVKENFVSTGMCADWSIHDKNDGNPHAHILLTMRPISDDGSWEKKQTRRGYKLDQDGNKIPVIDPETGEQKVRVRAGRGVEKLWVRESVEINPWNKRENAEIWRKSWADVCNSKLEKLEVDPIDHRSYERQGIDRLPTIHEGYEARQMEKEGHVSDRCQENRKTQVINYFLDDIESRIDNRSLVRFIIDKVFEIGDKISNIPDMIKAVTKIIAEEIFKFDLFEKLQTRRRVDNGGTDTGTDATNRSGSGGERETDAGRAEDFLAAVDSAVKLPTVRGVDIAEKRCLDIDGPEVSGDTVRREPDPVDADDARYEGRVDQGL